jgi:hypothetical protein
VQAVVAVQVAHRITEQQEQIQYSIQLHQQAAALAH